MDEPYYLAYEDRYKKVFEAGIECWGHSSGDEVLVSTLKKWVMDNKLQGKRVIEFACGEGAGGEILSNLGCIYHGVDISPTVIEKARKTLERYQNASVSLMDMVNDKINEAYDAAVDITGLHMLVLDSDRKKYLQNVYGCLKNGAPMLFFGESYREDAPGLNTKIESMEQWQKITGDDYNTPGLRSSSKNGITVQVSIPFVPARAKNKRGYISEFESAGFIVDEFVGMGKNEQTILSVSIFVHKPN